MTEAQQILAQRRKQTADRLPPHAPEAELCVLSCVLQSPEASLNRLAEKRVTPDWFYDARHQVVFNAMNGLHAKRDVPVDLITLGQFLKDDGKLEQIGGTEFLCHMEEVAHSPANLLYWLDILREKFLLRRVLATATRLVEQAFEHTGAVAHLLADAEHELDLLSGVLLEQKEQHIRHVLANEVLPQLEEHYTRGKQKLRGLSTGFTYMDKLVRGVRPNFYFVIAARPGDGKTSMAMNLCEHVAAQGHAVGVFTLEMTADSLATRLLFSVADVDSGGFEQGFATKGDFDDLSAGAAKLAAQNIYLDAEPDQTIDMIAAKARRWVKDYGIKLFVLDYLQLLDDESGYRNDRVQALRRISKKIVSLKNKLNVPWLVLAQMNRNIETAEVKRAPVLSDLKECGAIEQDADIVMMLYPPLAKEMEHKDGRSHKEMIQDAMQRTNVKRDDWPRRVNASVVKNRYGPVGVVQMLFQSNRCRFHDWPDWARSKGVLEYGKGDRQSANPEVTA